MINKDLLAKYEFIASTTQDSYLMIAEKFEFDTKIAKDFKNSNFKADVTKEHFGILFVDCKNSSVDISPCRDVIKIQYSDKDCSMPKTTKPFLVVLKYAKESIFKFYGVFEQSFYSSKKVELKQFNPTYYKDKVTTRFDY